MEDQSAVIPTSAIVFPSPPPTFKITPESKHQIHNQKFTISSLISTVSIFAFVEYFNNVIRTHFSKNSVKLHKIRVNTILYIYAYLQGDLSNIRAMLRNRLNSESSQEGELNKMAPRRNVAGNGIKWKCGSKKSSPIP